MIEVSDKENMRIVTLNRVEKANALTATMLGALCEAVTGTGSNTRALILTGAGSVFSAGADLDEARAGLATSGLWEELSGAVASCDCLTIAALNGTVAGGAFGMVLACDLRVAAPQTKFFYPVMRLGFLPQPSDPRRLSGLVGPARAKMILMAGQKIAAEKALAWGLVDDIVENGEVVEAAATLAGDALSAKPAHVTAIKQMH